MPSPIKIGHTDDELVDRVLVKKGGDELAAAHQADILAMLLTEPAYERTDWTAHEFHASRRISNRSLDLKPSLPTWFF